MEKPPSYISLVVASLEGDNNINKDALCAFCTAAIWFTSGDRISIATSFCTKMHRDSWRSDEGKKPITRCDGFTDKPVEE